MHTFLEDDKKITQHMFIYPITKQLISMVEKRMINREAK